jgi:hypothetical protein
MKTAPHVLRSCKETLYYEKQNSAFLITGKPSNFRLFENVDHESGSKLLIYYVFALNSCHSLNTILSLTLVYTSS